MYEYISPERLAVLKKDHIALKGREITLTTQIAVATHERLNVQNRMDFLEEEMDILVDALLTQACAKE